MVTRRALFMNGANPLIRQLCHEVMACRRGEIRRARWVLETATGHGILLPHIGTSRQELEDWIQQWTRADVRQRVQKDLHQCDYLANTRELPHYVLAIFRAIVRYQYTAVELNTRPERLSALCTRATRVAEEKLLDPYHIQDIQTELRSLHKQIRKQWRS